MKEKMGICSLCGCACKLTKEHIPPQKAFNNQTVLYKTIDRAKSETRIKWGKKQRQGGYFDFALCNKCNNETGSWYASEYIRFVKECAVFSKPDNVEKILEINIKDLRPVRVLKQALVMMCATCGEGFASENPEIRKFILNRTEIGLPDYLKIFVYLRSHGGGRITGVSGILDTKKIETKVVAEVSWWPIGWVLTFSDIHEENLCDITYWSKFKFEEKKDICIRIPCLWTITHYPMDFRNPQQVLHDRFKSNMDRNRILKGS